ncbi:MAG: hypothetical protein A3D87_04815 [Omnitrophica WOR_2 bacterium RIFCSPHIGHO2_02_FULL_50_17]|nr:MAG: hypothetical protein A3D87_04815 [Omnitrophica WOR_2 bacterium RIFCSPHIGHO2_02_FULL_50_17]
MTPEQRQELMRLLGSGEEISPEWAKILFPPEKREYELVYYGKDRAEDIIADTLAVPLQPVRTFGRNGVDWHNMLIFGDNLQAMKTLLEMKKTGKLCNADGSSGVRLIYIDPPFATKQEFRGSQDQKAYQDKIVGSQFLEFLRKRLILLKELLADDGAIYVHLDWKKGHYIKTLMDEIFGERNFRNEIIVRRIRKNIREREQVKTLNYGHDVIYFYAKSDSHFISPPTKLANREGRWHAFDAPGIRSGMDYPLFGHKPPTGRHWMFSKERAQQMISVKKLKMNPKTSKPQYYIEPSEEDIRDTIWDDITASAFTSGYPTEKSEDLLKLIIEASSKSGDIVLDCFSGSGTTCAVAEKLNCRWIGIDCGKLSIYTIQKRLLNLHKGIGNKGSKLEPKPFTLYNAGLYDFSKLKELSWQDWRFFALQLFQCRDEKHRINGINFDGYRQGASVMIFNHMEIKHKEARITEETLQEIHEAVGSRVGNKVFIVAPALSFDFQQDYIDFDKVRYYALRIPYSIIHELHRREFTALKQPSDEMAVNDTIEAVGFDFIRTPELKYKTGTEKRKGDSGEYGFIKIETFKSEAVVREPFKKKGNLETLSMVMLDFNYDEELKTFDLDEVRYSDALQKEGWKVSFPLGQLGKKMMVFILDIYGNEARVLIDATAFRKRLVKKKRKKK